MSQTDSPLHSSSSEDFAAILDAELASSSSEEASPKWHDDGEDRSNDNERCKRHKGNDLKDFEARGPKVLEAMSVVVGSSEAFSDVQICPPHPGFIKNMCVRCGMLQDEETGVSFGYIHKDLKLGAEEIARLRVADIKNLLRHRKLYLVLDLDHTLLNSTRISDISPHEEYLRIESDPSKGDFNRSLFKMGKMHMLTKLRPFVHKFLKEASTMFEMYIYTMAERSYALEMANLLDPERLYFNSRIISQDNCTEKYQKGLDVVLGAENAVIILDDTEIVWLKHRENLILMERYNYFSSSLRQFGFTGESLSERRKDESEADGALVSILEVLKRAHKMFFDPGFGIDIEDRDIRQILRTIKSEILKECKIVFSRIFPTKFQAEKHQLWKMAEQLGATCSTEIGSSVTHVVAMDVGTEKARWAKQKKKFLVHPRWIEAAHYLWKRLPEDQFLVIPDAGEKQTE